MAFDRKTIIEFPVSTFGQFVGFAVLVAASVALTAWVRQKIGK